MIIRLERLRGGEGGNQIGSLRNAPPWIRSRRRWARAWKVAILQFKADHTHRSLLMLQYLLHSTTGDWCVLYQLGWIDENGKENNETSTADLMSLKPEVIKSRSRKVQSSIQVFIHSMQQRTRFLRSWTSQLWQPALRREWL